MESKTILDETYSEIEIKKSLFKAYIFPCINKEEYMARRNEIIKANDGARHYLEIYRISPSLEYASENKEPIKSAHIILEILKKRELTQIGIVLVRFFGGILLGASNLEKTYLQVFSDSFSHVEEVLEKELDTYDILVTTKDYNRLLNDDIIILNKEFLGATVNLTVSGENISEVLNKYTLLECTIGSPHKVKISI